MEKPTTKNDNLIKTMPDQETLEAFVRGLHGGARVSFNLEKGEFEWIVPRPGVTITQPKGEESRRQL